VTSRVIAIAGLALATAGCPGAGRHGQQPSWRGGEDEASAGPPRVIELSPAGEPAAAYNDAAAMPAPRSPIGDAVVAAVERAAVAAGKPAPRPDGRLFRAAGDLARIVPDDAPLSYGLIEFAMQHAGIIEPSPHLVVIRGPLEPADGIADKLDERLPAILGGAEFARIGVGVAQREGDDDDVVVLALQSSYVTTKAVPRALPAGGSTRLEGEVAPPFRDPEVFVSRSGGSVEKVAVTRVGERGFRAEIACGGRLGKQQIEINADDASGATVLANFPVWCGAEPPTRLVLEASDDDRAVLDGDEAERRMLRLVNRDRERNGLPPLAVDARLAAIARAHSEDMRATGLVGHISPTTGSAGDRVKAGGVHTSLVLENVARAYGVAEAEEGLMNSPGHRANLLAREPTHIGIGIVLGDVVAGRRELFVSQLFIRIAGELDRGAARKAIAGKLRAVRVVDDDPMLRAIAQELADAIAKGGEPKAAATRASAKLKSMGERYKKVTTVATTVADVADVEPGDNLRDASVAAYGLGIAQGDHPVMGARAVYVVLLYGHR
jgi:uncharacterized protein YkwD